MTEDLLLEAKVLISQAVQDKNLPEPKRLSLKVACLGLDRVLNYLAEQREWAEKIKSTRNPKLPTQLFPMFPNPLKR